jgi:hypothetical protein
MDEPLRSDFWVGREGDPSPDSRRYRYAARRLAAFPTFSVFPALAEAPPAL